MANRTTDSFVEEIHDMIAGLTRAQRERLSRTLATEAKERGCDKEDASLLRSVAKLAHAASIVDMRLTKERCQQIRKYLISNRVFTRREARDLTDTDVRRLIRATHKNPAKRKQAPVFFAQLDLRWPMVSAQ